MIKQFLLASVVSLGLMSSAVAVPVNQYWNLEDHDTYCVAYGSYARGSLRFTVNTDGVHLIITHPAMSHINDGDYSVTVLFDKFTGVSGTGRVRGNSMLIPNLSLGSVQRIMQANAMRVVFSGFDETYNLPGTDDAIRALVDCGQANGLFN